MAGRADYKPNVIHSIMSSESVRHSDDGASIGRLILFGIG